MHENTLVADLLRGHLALQPGAAAKHHALREYREAGLERLTVLLRKERTPVSPGLLTVEGRRHAHCCVPPALEWQRAFGQLETAGASPPAGQRVGVV